MANDRAPWLRSPRLAVGAGVIVLSLLLPLPVGATVSGEEGKIAFVRGRDIWVIEPDGSGETNLTNHPAADEEPDWSPDGRHIAFTSDRGPTGIWIVDADGSNPRFLTSGAEPAWSPDGKTIAYVSAGIRIIGTDGSGTRWLTDGTSPAFEPHGRSVIFWPHRPREPGSTPSSSRVDAYRVDVTTGEVTALGIDVFAGRNATHSDVSPDGRILAGNLTMITTPLGVYLADLTGEGGLSTIHSPDSLKLDPSWSPIGHRLAVTAADVHEETAHIAILDLSGDASQLTTTPVGEGLAFAYADWQPLNPYPVGLVDTSAGLWHLRDAEAAINTFYFGNPGDTPFLGDWDCDGVETPGVYRRSDGRIYLRNSNTQGIADYYFFFGNPGDLPMAGDFDGDGCDTVSLYRPSEQLFYISNELGANGGGLGDADYFFMFGNPGDKPFVGDFDGDGVDTIGLHRESTGLVYIRNSNTTGVAHHDFFYGNPGDRLVAADWNGDGKDSPAVFRPGNTTFYFRFTNTQGVADAQYIWGDNTWLPVSGDFAP